MFSLVLFVGQLLHSQNKAKRGSLPGLGECLLGGGLSSFCRVRRFSPDKTLLEKHCVKDAFDYDKGQNSPISGSPLDFCEFSPVDFSFSPDFLCTSNYTPNIAFYLPMIYFSEVISREFTNTDPNP